MGQKMLESMNAAPQNGGACQDSGRGKKGPPSPCTLPKVLLRDINARIGQLWVAQKLPSCLQWADSGVGLVSKGDSTGCNTFD